MCLGIPGKIVEIDSIEKWAVIECFGVHNKVYTDLVDQHISIGDYLMVHAGYAIGKVEAEDALETLTLFEKLLPEE
jgi:hydrogenase expression/formation protein HypC